jgi:hypothetical protein
LIEKWIDHSTERFLILKSEPGFGKTALAAWLAGAGPLPPDPASADLLSRIRRLWGAAYFCVGRTELDTVAAENFSASLAGQLKNAYPDYDEVVPEKFHVTFNASFQAESVENSIIKVVEVGKIVIPQGNPRRAYDLAVLKPLAALSQRRPGLKVFILVDGLDEALTNDSPTIIDLLVGSESLPAGVRFLLTCRRNEDRVLGAFPNAEKIDLSNEAMAARNEEDLRAYVEAHPVWERWRQSTRNTVKILDGLVEKADGNFLYLRFLLDEARAEGWDLGKLGSLPRGLPGLYRAYLDRLFPDRSQSQGQESWASVYEPLLGRLCIAEPAAPSALLPGWLGWRKSDVTSRLLNVRQLTEVVPDEHVPDRQGHRLYHRSMTEFLTTVGEGELNPYHVDPGPHHWELANHYLTNYAADWQDCDAYGLRLVVSHLKRAIEAAEFPAERRERTRQLYGVVLDPAFQRSQITKLGDSSATLSDLRLALALALEAGDVQNVLGCVRAYYETARGRAVSQGVFAAADAGEFATSLRRARHYAATSRWNQVLRAYLAWRAALTGHREFAEETAAEAVPKDTDYVTQEFEALAVALTWQTTLALARGGDAEATFDRLAPSKRWVLKQLQVDPTEPGEVRSALARLREVLTPHDRATYDREARTVSRDFADAEVMARRASELRDVLLRLVPHPQGQEEIDRTLGIVAANPYPFYRDLALCALGSVCAMSPDENWADSRLRQLLDVALDREGYVSTFDLPTLLTGPAPEFAGIQAILDRAVEDQGPWGTRIRSLSARAAVAHFQGRTGEAEADLHTAEQIRRGFAGLAVRHFLGLASRWLELGAPVRRVADVLDLAQEAVPEVQNYNLREHRAKLIQDYRGWLKEPVPSRPDAAARAGAIADVETRMAYLDMTTARWAAGGQAPDAAIVHLALADRTTLDAILGRLFRVAKLKWAAVNGAWLADWCAWWLAAQALGSGAQVGAGGLGC